MYIKKEIMTPAKAQELLSTSNGNRVIKDKQVKKLTRDMINGDFKDSNDLICVNTEGHLVNGQHRLTAICKSGVVIPMYVAYDFDEVGIIDRPAIRTTADTLRMHGLIDSKLCTKECVGLVNCYIKTKFSDFSFWTDVEKEAFIDENAESLSLALDISHKGANHPILKKASVQAAIFAAVDSGVSSAKLYRFAECVNTGFADGEKESAAIVLRNYLLTPNPMGGAHIQKEQTSVTEQAIRDFTNERGRRKAYPVDRHVYIIPEAKEAS